MKQSLPLFSTQVGIGITEDKSNCREEVAFAGSVATNDDIVLMRKRFNYGLFLVANKIDTISSILTSIQVPIRTIHLLKP